MTPKRRTLNLSVIFTNEINIKKVLNLLKDGDEHGKLNT